MVFGLYHPVSEFSLFYSFHLLPNRNGLKKFERLRIVSVSSFHFVSPCFATSLDQSCRFVSSCFRIFPIYLMRIIC